MLTKHLNFQIYKRVKRNELDRERGKHLGKRDFSIKQLERQHTSFFDIRSFDEEDNASIVMKTWDYNK